MIHPAGSPMGESESRRLFVATGNAHKLREFAEILGPLGFTVLGWGDVVDRAGRPLHVSEPEETAPDFSGNAEIKCLHAAALLRVGFADAIIADDSGLAVDLLDGEPGVFSARFAERAGRGQGDAANRAELVRRLRLRGLAGDSRTPAAFVCALHLIDRERRHLAVLGRCEGLVGLEEAGSGGFGYDALFTPLDEAGRPLGGTFAQLSAKEKHALSHRGRALRLLAGELSGFFST